MINKIEIKKFNNFINEENEADIFDISASLENLLIMEKHIKLSVNDMLYDSGIILELNSGKILEKLSFDIDWKEYESIDEFKELTGASLENEYQGNKSEELLKLLNSFEHNLNIKSAYFEGIPSEILKLILK